MLDNNPWEKGAKFQLFISFIQHSIDPYMVSPSNTGHIIQKELIIKSSNKR